MPLVIAKFIFFFYFTRWKDECGGLWEEVSKQLTAKLSFQTNQVVVAQLVDVFGGQVRKTHKGKQIFQVLAPFLARVAYPVQDGFQQFIIITKLFTEKEKRNVKNTS